LGHQAAVEVVGNGPQQGGDSMEDHAGDIRELNLGEEQLVIRLTGTCRLPRITGRRGKRERWRW